MTNGTTLTVRTPADFRLPRDVCSYGYFVLFPNHWDTRRERLIRVLHLNDGPATARITQPVPTQPVIRARFDRRLSRPEQDLARTQIARMLRLDEDASHSRAFHRVDPRWKRSGRSRLFRSPTLFEDVIKTVSSCNVAWPSTVGMNRRFCEVLGSKAPSGLCAFPTPHKLARTRAGTLRGRCRVGYRDQRMIDLAKLFVNGHIDEAWLTNPATSDDDVFNFLISLPGIGPYAAGNIMMLLGRYARLAIDTESVRHGKNVLGMTGTDRAISKQLAAHYESFGVYRFKSYWFELWDFYESHAGPATTWERDTTATAFTASKF